MQFDQVAIAGTYWPPFLADLGLAAVLFLGMHLLLSRVRLHRFVWHPALFEVALFTCVLSAIILLFNP